MKKIKFYFFKMNTSNWQSYNNDFIFLQGNIINSNKIFAFDIDQTLITFKNGQDPAKYNDTEPDNWIFFRSS